MSCVCFICACHVYLPPATLHESLWTVVSASVSLLAGRLHRLTGLRHSVTARCCSFGECPHLLHCLSLFYFINNPIRKCSLFVFGICGQFAIHKSLEFSGIFLSGLFFRADLELKRASLHLAPAPFFLGHWTCPQVLFFSST